MQTEMQVLRKLVQQCRIQSGLNDVDLSWLLEDQSFEKMGESMSLNHFKLLGLYNELPTFLTQINVCRNVVWERAMRCLFSCNCMELIHGLGELVRFFSNISLHKLSYCTSSSLRRSQPFYAPYWVNYWKIHPTNCCSQLFGKESVTASY